MVQTTTGTTTAETIQQIQTYLFIIFFKSVRKFKDNIYFRAIPQIPSFEMVQLKFPIYRFESSDRESRG